MDASLHGLYNVAVSDARYDSYVSAWRERWRAERARAEADAAARRQAVERMLPELARRLAALGARRVWLVGSFARGDAGPRSDLDLAVEGVPPERWAEAERATEAIAGAVAPVDLVPVESARSRFKEAVAREGRLLHDAG